MICKECKAEIDDDSKFCGKCGKVVESLSVSITEKKPKKKSKKPVIISACVALLAGLLVLGFFFMNEVLHFILGDVLFAKIVEGASITHVTNGEKTDDGEMDAFIAKALTGGFKSGNYNTSINEILSEYGGVEMRLGLDVEPGLLLGFLFSQEKLDMLFSGESVIRFTEDENCNLITYAFEEGGEEIFHINFYNDNEKSYISAPDITDKGFYTESDEDVIKDVPEFSSEEVKRIRKELTEIYVSAYNRAKITYTKDEYQVNSIDLVECEEVRVYFDEEVTSEIVEEMRDYLKNDAYVREYYVLSTGRDISEYEALFDDFKSEGHTFTVINYLGPRLKVLGKEYETGGAEDVSSVAFSRHGRGVDFSLFNSGIFNFTVNTIRNDDNTSGLIKITLELVEDGELLPPLVFDITYSELGTAEFNGKTINTGNYTLKISADDKYLGEKLGKILDLSASSITLVTTCDESGLKGTLGINLHGVADITIDASLVPYEGEKAVMPDTEGAIYLDNELTGEELEVINNIIADAITKLSEKSEFFATIAQYAGLLDTVIGETGDSI